MIKTIIGIRSAVLILAIIALVSFAYFGDRSTSGDTFAVGEVDIMVGNDSYYNGTISADTSWSVSNLTLEKFFNFSNVVPEDYGEDTIAIQVLNEDTYLCVDVRLTSNDENDCNEPEVLEDVTCGNPGNDEGELSSLIEFMWWADDGDNVFEDDEQIIFQGPIDSLVLNVPTTITLADTDTNIWTGVGGAIPESSTLYLGKAWCYGSISSDALAQDGQSSNWSPVDDNDASGTAGEPEDGGFTCIGNTLGNESQTDSVTADVSFSATQAFGNDGYLCGV